MLVPHKLIRAWEQAYRRYGNASEHVARTKGQSAPELAVMAEASGEVATAWRHIAGSADLPWWTLAALESAASAFDKQAQHCDENAPAPPVPEETGG